MSARTETLTAGAEALIAALAAEGDLYASMLGVCHREEDAIVGGNVEQLTALTEEKELLIEHLHALETERMTALVAIASAADDLDAGTATLEQVSAVLPATIVGRLTEQGRHARERAVAAEEANRRNAALLRQSRDVIDRWIVYLRTLLTGAIYTSEGGAREVAGGRTLDRSA